MRGGDVLGGGGGELQQLRGGEVLGRRAAGLHQLLAGKLPGQGRGGRLRLVPVGLLLRQHGVERLRRVRVPLRAVQHLRRGGVLPVRRGQLQPEPRGGRVPELPRRNIPGLGGPKRLQFVLGRLLLPSRGDCHERVPSRQLLRGHVGWPDRVRRRSLVARPELKLSRLRLRHLSARHRRGELHRLRRRPVPRHDGRHELRAVPSGLDVRFGRPHPRPNTRGVVQRSGLRRFDLVRRGNFLGGGELQLQRLPRRQVLCGRRICVRGLCSGQIPERRRLSFVHPVRGGLLLPCHRHRRLLDLPLPARHVLCRGRSGLLQLWRRQLPGFDGHDELHRLPPRKLRSRHWSTLLLSMPGWVLLLEHRHGLGVRVALHIGQVLGQRCLALHKLRREHVSGQLGLQQLHSVRIGPVSGEHGLEFFLPELSNGLLLPPR